MTDPAEIEARMAVLERTVVTLMRVIQESDPMCGPLIVDGLKAHAAWADYAKRPAEEIAAHRALLDRAVEAKIG